MKQNIYIVLDVSGSMFGEPMESMKNGVDDLLSALCRSSGIDMDNTFVSVITFSTTARIVVAKASLQGFVRPEIKAGGCTNCAKMMDLLLEAVDAEAEKEPESIKSSMVFFFMDGYPTDASKSIEKSIEAFHAREWGAYASFAIAGGAEKHFLARLTSPRRVFDLTINPDFQAAIAPLPSRQKGAVQDV